jgi:signal transduction histidine kinase
VIDVNDYSIKLANSAAQIGPIIDNRTCYEMTHNSDKPCEGDEHPCPIKEIIKTRKPVVLEHVHRSDDGKQHIVEVYGYPIFDNEGEIVQIIEYNFDVTDKKNLEFQLQQSQKLEAVGTLTGGVAHDFNNLLTTILGYSQLDIMAKEEGDPDRESIEAIYEASVKASELVQQLLAFSRKQVMDIKVVNLNSLVTNISKMLKRLIGEDIEFDMLINDGIGNIKADPGQVEQIVMNLVVNARDAMPSGGNLYLESDSVELDEEYCKTHAQVTPGFYVLLSVTDTGMGMASEVKEKIFDPFYTTKELGQGTGLGLATVYGIVNQMKGHIYVYSELDRGTTFKIYFPEVHDEVDEIKKEKGVLLPGTETILVVDDEESILRLVKDTLQPLGYNILTASSAESALEMAEDSGTDIDLLLTDVIMRNMNGMELSGEMALLQPNTKVLFMSGYTDNVIVKKGIMKEGVNFIQKPIFPTMLTSRIRSVLGNGN